MILAGDTVRIYPHGSPDQAATGRVVMCGKHQKMIIIRFETQPPFARSPGPDATFQALGIFFFGHRHLVGPWIEWFREGHYEIETAEIIEEGKAIHCLRCGMTSHSGQDVSNLYCGKCHRFHEPTAIRGMEHWV